MGVIDRSEAIFAAFSRVRQFARYSLGRVTGTTTSSDGKYKYFLEVSESRHFHRVEINALTALLVKKGIFTEGEWSKQLLDEVTMYETFLKKEWPEVTPAQDGRSLSIDTQAASERISKENWPM